MQRLVRTWSAFLTTVCVASVLLAGGMYWFGRGIFARYAVGGEAFVYLSAMGFLIVLPVAYMFRLMWFSATPPEERDAAAEDVPRCRS